MTDLTLFEKNEHFNCDITLEFTGFDEIEPNNRSILEKFKVRNLLFPFPNVKTWMFIGIWEDKNYQNAEPLGS